MLCCVFNGCYRVKEERGGRAKVRSNQCVYVLTDCVFVSRVLLRSPDIQRDPRRYIQAVQKVIACMTLGIDVSKLFSEMIMVTISL